MPQQFDPPGLRHYVDHEAAAMNLADGPDNHHPVAKAYDSAPLQQIGQFVTTASDNRSSPATVAEALENAADQLDAILLSYRAGVAMLIDAHRGLEVDVPGWLKVHSFAADPTRNNSVIRTVTEEAKVKELTQQIATSGIVPPSTAERPFLQDENPYPPPDPSPFHLANPHLDPRNHPRPPGHEIDQPDEPNPESLPGPRQVADGKTTRGRGKTKGRPDHTNDQGINAEPTDAVTPQLPAPVIGAPPAHDISNEPTSNPGPAPVIPDDSTVNLPAVPAEPTQPTPEPTPDGDHQPASASA